MLSAQRALCNYGVIMFVNRDLAQFNECESRETYDALYAQDRWLPDRSSLFHLILKLLKPEPASKLLDVACGDGQMAPIAKEAGVHYFGIDFSHSAISKAKPAPVSTANGETLPFPANTFDYVTNIGSLEHFSSMDRAIQEMRRVLKLNGLACVMVPNAFSLTWNVLRVWATGDLADDDGQPLQRFATRDAWQSLLIQNGLHPIKIYGYERIWPRTTADLRIYRAQPKELLLGILAPFLPLDAKRSFVFLCRSDQNSLLVTPS